MKKVLFISIIVCVLLRLDVFAQTSIYEVKSGEVKFHSNAQRELIKASSKSVAGVVDMSKRTFLFKLGVATFVGFNSPLQKEHFNENYLETEQYPMASFSGRIIEDIDLLKDGVYTVRAKGKLTIHGVERQRTIKCHITCKNGTVNVQSEFEVLLADHDIKVPRIVSDKLSPEIDVSVTAILAPGTLKPDEIRPGG